MPGMPVIMSLAAVLIFNTSLLVGLAQANPLEYIEMSDNDNSDAYMNEYQSILEERGSNPTLYTSYKCYRAGSSTPVDVSLEKASLFAHNECRKKHGFTQLSWDTVLAKTAETHACSMAKNRKMDHSSKALAGKFGENLAYLGISITNVRHAIPPMVTAWFNEIKNFTFNSPNNAPKGTGHFSQMCWKTVTKVGCGLCAINDNGWTKTYYACQYSPPGNVVGFYAYNVKKPLNNKIKEITKFDLLDVQGCCDYDKSCKIYRNSCNSVGRMCPATCGLCANP